MRERWLQTDGAAAAQIADLNNTVDANPNCPADLKGQLHHTGACEYRLY